MWARLGIYDDNRDEAVWPRSVKLHGQAWINFHNAIMNTIENANPHATAAQIRALVKQHVGTQWENENNEWYRKVLDLFLYRNPPKVSAVMLNEFPLEGD